MNLNENVILLLSFLSTLIEKLTRLSKENSKFKHSRHRLISPGKTKASRCYPCSKEHASVASQFNLIFLRQKQPLTGILTSPPAFVAVHHFYPSCSIVRINSKIKPLSTAQLWRPFAPLSCTSLRQPSFHVLTIFW